MNSNALQLHLASVPVLDDILRDGARRALQSAIEREVDEYLQRNRHHVDERGHQLVVRNGHHPARTIQSGTGGIEVRQPRVNDKRIDEDGKRIRFTSKILPPYLRKTRAIEELVPWLYLKGISTSDFPEALLHEIWLSATREDAFKAFDRFVQTYQAKYPKAVECLLKDKDELLAFYDFPAEHWQHLRTSNPIESTFATVRLRTCKTKGAGSRSACLAMAFKLVESAQNRWRKLNGSLLLPEVVAGVVFKDGVKLAA